MKFPLKLIWFHFNRQTQTFKVSNLKRAKNFEQKKFPKAQSQKLFSTRRLPSRIEKNLFLSGKLLPDLRRTSLYAPQCIQINKFLWKVSRKKFLALLKVGGGAYSKKFLQKCKFDAEFTIHPQSLLPQALSLIRVFLFVFSYICELGHVSLVWRSRTETRKEKEN